MEYALGIDVGSSSVKVSLLDLKTGRAAASASAPETEAPIAAPQKGWAEQAPDAWWSYLGQAIERIGASCDLSGVRAIGISYQMHGLVTVDRAMHPLRDAIIWCDSRAVGIGAEAFEGIGEQRCLEHLLNAPGNFTATCDLTPAYPAELGLKKCVRKLRFDGEKLTVTDSFTAEKPLEMTVRLFHECPGVEVAGAGFTTARAELPLADSWLRAAWGEKLYETRLAAPKAAAGEITCVIFPK